MGVPQRDECPPAPRLWSAPPPDFRYRSAPTPAVLLPPSRPPDSPTRDAGPASSGPPPLCRPPPDNIRPAEIPRSSLRIPARPCYAPSPAAPRLDFGFPPPRSRDVPPLCCRHWDASPPPAPPQHLLSSSGRIRRVFPASPGVPPAVGSPAGRWIFFRIGRIGHFERRRERFQIGARAREGEYIHRRNAYYNGKSLTLKGGAASASVT